VKLQSGGGEVACRDVSLVVVEDQMESKAAAVAVISRGLVPTLLVTVGDAVEVAGLKTVIVSVYDFSWGSQRAGRGRFVREQMNSRLAHERESDGGSWYAWVRRGGWTSLPLACPCCCKWMAKRAVPASRAVAGKAAEGRR